MIHLHADGILDVLSLVMGKDKIVGCAVHDAEVKATVMRFYIATRLHFLIKGENRAKEERRKMARFRKCASAHDVTRWKSPEQHDIWFL